MRSLAAEGSWPVPAGRHHAVAAAVECRNGRGSTGEPENGSGSLCHKLSRSRNDRLHRNFTAPGHDSARPCTGHEAWACLGRNPWRLPGMEAPRPNTHGLVSLKRSHTSGCQRIRPSPQPRRQSIPVSCKHLSNRHGRPFKPSPGHETAPHTPNNPSPGHSGHLPTVIGIRQNS